MEAQYFMIMELLLLIMV